MLIIIALSVLSGKFSKNTEGKFSLEHTLSILLVALGILYWQYMREVDAGKTMNRQVNTKDTDADKSAILGDSQEYFAIRRDKIVLFLIFCGFILLMLLPQLYLWSHITDDAYISFRYADRLANGHGLTFNDNEYVEGFSNPLWVLLLAITFKITHLQLPDLARIFGLLFSILTLAGILWICAEWRDMKQRIIVFASSAAILIVNPGFHIYATAGLEGPLFTLLLVFGIKATIKNSNYWHILAAISFGFIGITRPEGSLYAIIWYLTTIKRGKNSRISLKYEFLGLFIMLLPIVAYEIFRLYYYKALLPNTAIAKPSGHFGGFYGMRYIIPWTVAIGGPFLIALITISRVEFDDKFKLLIKACSGPILASLIFIIYAQNDWMFFGRFIVPVYPLVAMLLSGWLYFFVSNLKETGKLRFGRTAIVIILAGILLSSPIAWKSQLGKYIRNEEVAMIMHGHDQVVVGKWLAKNITAGSSVATIRIGAISFFAPKLKIWDLDGLTNSEQAKFLKNNRPALITESPVIHRMPDVIAAVAVPAGWSYRKKTDMVQFLNENYDSVTSFKQGKFGTIDIWRKKNRL